MRKLFGILLLSFYPTYLAAQDMTVIASVNETTIGTEETLTYTIEIRGANPGVIQTPSPPRPEGLTILQTVPGTQRNVSITNGVVEQSYGFNWSYRPLGEGKVELGQVSVRVGSTNYLTESIAVTIVPQSQRPKRTTRPGLRLDPFSALFNTPEPEEDLEPDPGDIFIRVISSRQSVVQNEQVTIEYQLFFREGIQLRQSRLTDSWDAEGFWREELDVETRPIPQIVVENGVRFNKIVLKRAAVFPTRAGTLTVDPLRIESEAVLPSRSRDPFQQLFSLRSRFRPVELASPPVVIESLALPGQAPASFSGAVGQYRMTSVVDRTELDVGESLQLVIRISGTGNLATLDAPVFEPPAAFELYDPQIKTNLTRSGRYLSGTKTFTFVMVPRSNGSFELPAVEFSYFDPEGARYRTDYAAATPIRVTGSNADPIAIAATAAGLPVDDVAPPMDQAGVWVRLGAPALHGETWPYVALLLPLIILGAVFLVQRHHNRLGMDVTYARKRRAHPLARKHLKEARRLKTIGETASFFGEVERAVLGFIGNRLNISERGLTRTQLDSVLEAASLDPALRLRLKNLLDACDRGRFAPASVRSADLSEAYDDAANFIVSLNSAFTAKA